MQKQLGQDIKDLAKRRQFLLDNADEVVEMSYHKAFDADTLADRIDEHQVKIKVKESALKARKQ